MRPKPKQLFDQATLWVSQALHSIPNRVAVRSGIEYEGSAHALRRLTETLKHRRLLELARHIPSGSVYWEASYAKGVRPVDLGRRRFN